MNMLLHFAGPAQGQIPEQATAVAAVVMGKDLGAGAADHFANMIKHAIDDGVARPVNALNANVIATPGGGLRPMGHETTKYKYKGGEMFGIEAPAPKR